METAQAIQSGAPIPLYPEDDFLEQEQFYLDREEPENKTENAEED